MKPNPPRFAKVFLQWFCHADFIEEVEGDLFELFQERVAQHGRFKANLLYFIDVWYCVLGHRGTSRTKTFSQSLMLRDRAGHFFKIAWRNMIRSRASTLINLTGLAVSLVTFLLIALYLVDEATYDAFHPDAENTYRISYSFKGFDGKEYKDSRAAGMWSVALKESMPEVKAFTRFSRFGYPGKVWRGNPDHVFVESLFMWVDSTYTDIFNLSLVTPGNARDLLRNPQYVIINERTATKYFGDADPVGQSITYMRDGMSFPLIVGAVMKNYPANAHFKPDFLASNLVLEPLWKQNGADRINSWGDSFSYSFIKLPAGIDLSKVTDALQRIFNEHLENRAATTHPVITPLREIHFTTGQAFELEAPGDKTHLYIFASVGLLILGMACINYMNLATARSMRRSKEVGLSKTLGVTKLSLVCRFLGESLLMTLIALAISLVLLVVLLPSFNALTMKDFSLFSIMNTEIIGVVAAAIVFVGVIAGSYPAFYLSGFRPIEALKGTIRQSRGPENFRKTLVVVQISITLLLLAGTYVIQKQLAFIDHTRLSEHQSQILTVRLGDGIAEKIPVYKQMAKKDSRVKEISTAPHLPRRESFGNLGRAFRFNQIDQTVRNWEQLDVDDDFFSMFELELVAGTLFSSKEATDSTGILINEKAANDLGLTAEKALGLIAEETIYYEQNGEMVPVNSQHTIIGVVKDFNYASLRIPIGPLAISKQPLSSEMMYVKMEGGNYNDIIAHLQNTWKQLYPATPFQYWFMDEEFGRLYQAERQMAKLILYLSGVAILIACLGLFGLASYTAEQRTKEIGIRKVLGASSLQVFVLLTSRYIRLTLLSFVIGIPTAFIAIRAWMETFVYKADLGNGFYVWVCLLILIMTIFIVGLESLRVARANPSDSIRHE